MNIFKNNTIYEFITINTMTTKQIEWTTTTKQYIIGKTYKKKINLKNKKIASFDLDHTLIKPANNQKFSETDSDWILYDKCVPSKLKKLDEEGYELVIVTNQNGVAKGKVDIETFKSKMQKIVNYFGLNFTIYAAFEDDLYRKPRIKLWTEFINGDTNTSFYCGDAAGLKGDFSDTDFKFALNVGMKFMYRDEFLFDKVETLNPEYPVKFDEILGEQKYKFVPNKEQEVIINVGFPGSGKTYFTKTYVLPHDYVHINQDTLKTKAKCLKAFKEALKKNKSVVVDNTNLGSDSRKLYLDVAKEYKVKCRCLHYVVAKEVCKHNAYYRNYVTDGQTKPIPRIVYNMMNKKFTEPTKEEGFFEIDKIDFKLDFDDENDIKLYKNFFY